MCSKKPAAPVKNSRIRGFTLIEVAIVIVIGSLLLSLLAGYLSNVMQQSKITATNMRMKTIETSLKTYLSRNNRLPKPAPRTEALNTANYAREITGSPTAPGVLSTAGTGGRAVLIGMIPTRTLNLPDEYGYDGWGSRIVYVVTDVLTAAATFDMSKGAISIEDSASNSIITPAGSATFLILSVGPDREDGYTAAGVLTSACPTTGLDRNNCDGNSRFVDTLSYSDSAATQFDDYVLYEAGFSVSDGSIPAGAVMAFNATTCPEGWAAVSDMAGRTIIGAGSWTDPGNPPTTIIGSSNKTYGVGQTDGYSTRYHPLLNFLKVNNMPPYKVFLYCEKTGP